MQCARRIIDFKARLCNASTDKKRIIKKTRTYLHKLQSAVSNDLVLVLVFPPAEKHWKLKHRKLIIAIDINATTAPTGHRECQI